MKSQTNQDSKDMKSNGSATSTQGGTHEQHVKAGQQSHKNDQPSGSSAKASGASSGSDSRSKSSDNRSAHR